MAKLEVKNLKQVQTRIRTKIRTQLRSKDIQSGVVKIVVDDIQKNTSPAGKVTQEWRKYLEKGNKTDPKYKRSKINVTFTGELLRDLVKNIVSDFKGSKSQFIIEHSDELHTKYKKPDGSDTKGKQKTMKEISKYVQDKGYEYMTFSDKTQSKVIKFIRKEVISKLSKK